MPAVEGHERRGVAHRPARELVIHTGLGHGFLYRPLPAWLDPVLEWVDAR